MRQFDANVFGDALTVYFFMIRAAQSTREKSAKLECREREKKRVLCCGRLSPLAKP
jgi:hypothetical protein